MFWWIIGGIVFLILCLYAAFFILFLIGKYQWNRGVCRRCGGNWKYTDLWDCFVKNRFLEFYTCNTCGRKIYIDTDSRIGSFMSVTGTQFDWADDPFRRN